MTKQSSHPFLLVNADGSYNPQGIMRHAWSEIRRPNRLFPDTPKPTRSQALRWAWNAARQQQATILHRIRLAAMQEAA